MKKRREDGGDRVTGGGRFHHQGTVRFDLMFDGCWSQSDVEVRGHDAKIVISAV